MRSDHLAKSYPKTPWRFCLLRLRCLLNAQPIPRKEMKPSLSAFRVQAWFTKRDYLCV